MLRPLPMKHVRLLVLTEDLQRASLALAQAESFHADTRPPEEARLRQAACLLADIGWRAHPEYRGEQSFNLIAHAAFIGIDHPGRAYLALANFYRHEGLIAEALSPRIRELTSTRLMERARALGATLRVAYLISGAMPDVVSRTRVETRGRALTLVLPADLAPLGGARVLRRLGVLAKLAGLEPAIVVE